MKIERPASAAWLKAIALATLCMVALVMLIGGREAEAQTVGPEDVGKLVAWGGNSQGQSSVPLSLSGVSGVKDIAAGTRHSLALEEDDTVVAWGDNSYGQTDVPSAARSGVKDIAAGTRHNLALEQDGKIVAWGDNSQGQTNVPAGLSAVKAISAGGLHSLALKEDGTVVAWGSNFYGQSSVPAGLSGVKAISAGSAHSLALKDTTSPADVDFFDADAADGEVSLTWNNPSTPDFQAVRILRSTTGAATSPEPSADQTQIYEGTAESFTDTGLTNATHYYYTIYAVDDNGNFSLRKIATATPQDATDTTAPDTTITQGPSGTVNSASATFTFTSSENGSTFECRLDESGEFTSCDSGIAYTNLSEGSHTFEVRAKDGAGNTDETPASRTWTVDATAPETTITSGPSEGARVNATRQAFSFASTEAGSTFECSVNGAAFSACSSGDTFTFIVGSNTFEVKATDAAGNRDQTPANRAFTVDTTAPGAPSITAPATNSFDRDGSFDIRGTAEPGSTVRLYEVATHVGTDEADPQSGAWTIALVNVPEGSHAYKAKATDAAGNVSSDSQPTTVVVDKTAPTLTAKTPTGTTVARNTSVSATFSERMDEASIEAAGTVTLVLVGKKGKTTPVAASVIYDSDTKTVTLDPATNLGSKATYTATITAAAKDVAGNPLAQPETWTFTTAAR